MGFMAAACRVERGSGAKPTTDERRPVSRRELALVTSLSRDAAVAAVQLAIAESAMRAVMNRNASAAGDDATRFCLQLFGEDPAPAYLARFDDVPTPIVAGSAFRLRTDPEDEHRDIKIWCDRLGIVDERVAYASAGYEEGTMSAAGDELWLELHEGRWVVIRREQAWIV